ncbi:MAG: serine/threonine-protein phosphatase [Labilithrix sp.]|nr:serine/threonine-protein phosphatase [Labilithrix sp.]
MAIASPPRSTQTDDTYVSVAAQTDIGRVRENNEDAFVVADLTGGALLGGASHARFDVGERGVLLAVSDGMGGAHAGEVASALVVETLTRALAKASPGTPRDALMNDAIQRAHLAVWDAARREEKKMGATLTAVFVHAGQAYIAEVGDSRAYLVRAGTITRLTHDQSMVQMLLDSGVIKPEDARESPLRNVILQAMGHQHDVKVALAKLELRQRDCLVLCSDGLTGHLTDDEIRDVVLASGRPERAVGQLVDLANERGGKDNITVVVAGVGGALAEADAAEPVDGTFQVLTTFEPPVSNGGT